MVILYKKIESITEFIDAIRIRVDVFIKEQRGEPGWEPDEEDKNSRHYIAIEKGEVIGTLRLREYPKGEMKVERLAVKKEYRSKGIGKGLLEYAIKDAKKLETKRIWMQAQCQAESFYNKCGFKSISKPYGLHGIEHLSMEYKE